MTLYSWDGREIPERPRVVGFVPCLPAAAEDGCCDAVGTIVDADDGLREGEPLCGADSHGEDDA